MMPVTTGLEATSPAHSSFVTSIAWLSIVASLLLVLLCVLGWLVLRAPAESLTELLAAGGIVLTPDRLARWQRELPLTALLGVMLTVISVALLRRREWARIAFIVTLVAGALWGLLEAFWSAFPGGAAPELETMFEAMPEFAPLLPLIRLLSAVLALAIVAVHLWLIQRFRSSEIRTQFKSSLG